MKPYAHTFSQKLNGKLLDELYDGDEEHALIVFEQFLSTSPAFMNEIETNFTAGQIEPFRKSVHKIKPIFSYVGLSGLSDIAEKLEKNCRDINRINEIEPLYTQLKEQYSEGINIIKEETELLKS